MKKYLLTLFFCSLCLVGSVTAQRARQVVLFTDGWKFHHGEILNGESESFDDAGWRTVELPHDWSIEGPFSKEWASGTGFLPGGVGWYRKTFNVDNTSSEKKVFLYFDGVYKNSEVWLNGHSLGKRPNGYIPFQYELTPFLKKGKNIVAVKVDHSKFADSRWYPGSGIYRNVYLITTSPLHISLWGTRFTTPLVSPEKAIAEVMVSVKNEYDVASAVRIEVKLNSGTTVAASSRQSTTVSGGTTQEVKLTLNVRVERAARGAAGAPQAQTLPARLRRACVRLSRTAPTPS